MINDLLLSTQQKSIIIGSLLGDGSISKIRYGKSYFSKSQTARRIEYLEWTHAELQPFSSSVRTYENFAEGKRYLKSVFTTKSYHYFADLRKMWYPAGTKIVPPNVKLDPLSIAIWYCDDGSNCVDNRSCKLATYCFSAQDCEILVAKLETFGIKSYFDNQNVINVRACCYFDFIELVKPHIAFNCFTYKLKYRESKTKFLTREQIESIPLMFDEGNNLSQIAGKLGCSISSVSDILRGKRSNVGRKFTVACSNTSGETYISFDKERNKWMAHWKRKFLGRFDTKEEAIIAKREYEKKITCSSS